MTTPFWWLIVDSPSAAAAGGGGDGDYFWDGNFVQCDFVVVVVVVSFCREIVDWSYDFGDTR